MIGEQTSAIGQMVTDSWRRGRRVGFVEGAACGFLLGVFAVLVRFL